MQEFIFCLFINYAYIYTWMHVNLRIWRPQVRVKTKSETRERHTPHSPRTLRENIDQASASHPAKPILRKSTTVLQSKRSIDKIRWFEFQFYPQLVHENSLANPFSDFPIERQRRKSKKSGFEFRNWNPPWGRISRRWNPFSDFAFDWEIRI